MKTNRKYFTSIFIILAFISASVFADAGTDRRPPKEKWDYVEIQATVQAVDYVNRELTLMGTNGNIVTVDVDDRVKRLKEVLVGDVVTAEYWAYVSAEFRDPTPAELKAPLVVVAILCPGCGTSRSRIPHPCHDKLRRPPARSARRCHSIRRQRRTRRQRSCT